MHLNVKVITWYRIQLPNDTDIEEINKLSEKHSVEEITDLLCEKHGIGWQELIDITPECMEPHNNGGAPTLELYDGKDMVWDNGRKPDIGDIFNELGSHF